MKTVFMSAGEVSGDLQGSFLAKELYSLQPDLQITGFGGILMENAGVNVLINFTHLSGVGITENIPFLLLLKKKLSFAKKYFKKNPPDVLVLIDNQGFNLRLADIAKRYKIPVIYYICPQEWIWGFKKGPERIIAKVDKLISIFKQEFEFYKSFTDKIEFVGHPLLDILQIKNKKELRIKYGFPEKARIIGLLPGSRYHEIKSLLPVFLETVSLLKNEENDLIFLLISPEIWQEYISENYDLKGINFFSGQSSERMQLCDLLMVASGTVTLEAAILKIPFIACYKLSKLTFFFARLLFKLPFFTLPNIIGNKKIIPELIQDQVNSLNLKELSLNLLNNQEKRTEMLTDFSDLENELQPKGAIKTTAELIIKAII